MEGMVHCKFNGKFLKKNILSTLCKNIKNKTAETSCKCNTTITTPFSLAGPDMYGDNHKKLLVIRFVIKLNDFQKLNFFDLKQCLTTMIRQVVPKTTVVFSILPVQLIHLIRLLATSY